MAKLTENGRNAEVYRKRLKWIEIGAENFQEDISVSSLTEPKTFGHFGRKETKRTMPLMTEPCVLAMLQQILTAGLKALFCAEYKVKM